ncbi:rod shape-determining protein MreC [Phenylobacterium montanum]|uniref:Cell shape-determining protein MreC n=1 Tax=Phenylobacterium montanum TaxID=2823693 RepID=A0A975G553_9CAUL|nr:rod shape-determining protein MreC [Caulobacter sp. S6]
MRDSHFADLKAPLIWTASVAVLVAGVIAVAILIGDRRETLQAEAYGATKNVVDSVAAPVGGVVSAPVRWTGGGIDAIKGYFFAIGQNQALRKENIELERYRDAAIALNNENQRLRALLNLKTDPPIPMVTGHVVLDARGPFSNTRLADVGSEQGVAIGNPVMSERGLVGRVVGVAHGASRVLLLTDIASRTPVMVDRTNARAILTGEGGPNPKLAYMRGINPVKAGDRILTSGDGGVFPRGLPVGVAVMGLDGNWRVRLDSDFAAIDFVRILKFKDFSQFADQKALGESSLPPLAPAQAEAIKLLEQPKPKASPAATVPAPTGPAPQVSSAPVKPAAKPVTKPAAAPAKPALKPARSAAPGATP